MGSPMEGPPGDKETEEVSVLFGTNDGTVETAACIRVGEEAAPVSSPVLTSRAPTNFSECCDVVQSTIPSTVPPLVSFKKLWLSDSPNLRQCCWKVHVAPLCWK